MPNPDYLFSKLNYAEICLKEGNYEKVPEILEGKYDLKSLYPERDLFHITEVVYFMGVVGTCFAIMDMEEQARVYYNSLKKLAPDDQYTESLEKYLDAKTVQKALDVLARRADGHGDR